MYYGSNENKERKDMIETFPNNTDEDINTKQRRAEMPMLRPEERDLVSPLTGDDEYPVDDDCETNRTSDQVRIRANDENNGEYPDWDM